MRKWFFTIFVFLFVLGFSLFQIQTSEAGKINQAITKASTQKVEQQVLDEISTKGKTTFWVILHEKADLSPAFNIKKDKDRGDFVYKTLQAVADQSQAGIRAYLSSTGVKYFPFWISNTIQVRDAGTALLNQIASRPEVEKIVADRSYPLPPVMPGIEEKKINTTEWGLDNIQAPQVWSTFGVRGEGIVVANVDTGFQFNHPALVEKYRGNLGGGNFDHNYNWFDPSEVCGSPSTVPCDNNNHGTHTMGTMVGDDGDPGTNQIGVAPHAKFMGCKGCETNSCSDFALNTCGQFILAPTDLNGNNPDSNLWPHIVNNSWGGGPGDPFYQPVVDAWVASGIFPQFSIGNSGPSCGTGGSPGDFLNTYGAGAYSINNTIAGFSGRGPSGFDPNEIKPNIAGPGVNVRSSIANPPNGFGNFNGTSMASPHVAGTIALMWAAAPSLVRDIAATRAILDATATDVSDTSCGGTAADNNVWGEGRLNALAAVLGSPICSTGTLNGTVTDSVSAQPISGASITTANGPFDYSTTTDGSGNYTMDVCEGTYDVTASASGYTDQTVTGIGVTAGNTTTQNFQLVPLSTCIYEQDFNDATMEWIEEKATVTQPGDGFLHLSPLKKKAIGVADPSFAGASSGTYTFDIQFTGGTEAKNWLYITRVDKKNGLEILLKVGQGKVVVKDKNGATLAKGKGTFTFAPNTPYTVVITYNGTTLDVSVNGTAVITGFAPTRTLPTANIGGAAKLNDLLIDNVCVQ
jgi:subtilisin family serine protease